MVTLTAQQMSWLARVGRVLDDMPFPGDFPGQSDGLHITVTVHSNLTNEIIGTFSEEENVWLMETS